VFAVAQKLIFVCNLHGFQSTKGQSVGSGLLL